LPIVSSREAGTHGRTLAHEDDDGQRSFFATKESSATGGGAFARAGTPMIRRWYADEYDDATDTRWNIRKIGEIGALSRAPTNRGASSIINAARIRDARARCNPGIGETRHAPPTLEQNNIRFSGSPAPISVAYDNSLPRHGGILPVRLSLLVERTLRLDARISIPVLVVNLITVRPDDERAVSAAVVSAARFLVLLRAIRPEEGERLKDDKREQHEPTRPRARRAAERNENHRSGTWILGYIEGTWSEIVSHEKLLGEGVRDRSDQRRWQRER